MIKYETTYVINQTVYYSEIYQPPGVGLEEVLAQRQLPAEETVNGAIIIDDIDQHIPKWKTVAQYIEEDKLVDAMHRIFYLITIMGEGFDFVNMVNDEGLLHKLSHVKSGFETHSKESMKADADAFEISVPGTLLWALDQLNS